MVRNLVTQASDVHQFDHKQSRFLELPEAPAQGHRHARDQSQHRFSTMMVTPHSNSLVLRVIQTYFP